MSVFAIAARRVRAVDRVLPERFHSRPLLLAGALVLLGASQASGWRLCKPTLAFKEAQLSEMQPPTLRRTWTATVVVDASRCATTSGYFDVGFSRFEEGAPELDFHETFAWSTPSVKISVDFSAAEAVESYWIHSIEVCPCATTRRRRP
jgi:hypothetical protein